MLFFLRKELYVGNSPEKSGDIRRILSSNNIKYSYKVLSRNSSSAVVSGDRYRFTSINEDLSKNYTYYIYVYKKDYDCAIALINDLTR
ncbi:MAG: hypothetical protein RSB66_04570 [Clostridium sp.]